MSTPSSTKLSLRLTFLMSMPPLMWAGNAVVGRVFAGQVPPATLNLMRWVLAALVLLPLAWRSLQDAGGLAPVRARWPHLLLLGLLSVALYNALQYLALVSSTPMNVTLVACSMPVWMLAVGAMFFGQRPSTRQLLGAILSLIGVAVVVGRGSLATLLAVQLVPGDIYIIVAVIGFAIYSWLLARPPAHMRGSARPSWNWAAFLFIQVCFGVLASCVTVAVEHTVGATPVQWSWPLAAALVYVALGPAIVAYRCWGLGVAEGGPTLAATFGNLTPLFAALLSAWVLGEAPQAYHAIGFVLIAGGIWVSVRRAG